MSNRITFQFDDKLTYQEEAINSVINLFSGVSRRDDSVIYRNVNRVRKFAQGDPVCNPGIVEETRLLNNLRELQFKNMLLMDSKLYNNNFTIEMETGTGKTYVYLRTILELNKVYGFTKFMIVVPSVAIRKGVEKSIDMLREHFKALYDGLDIKNHSFVYDSSSPKKISSSLVETRDLSIAVINIQAFNKETNKIRQSDEYGQILWEDIKSIKPILIIDEPQKIEGTVKKKSASLEAIEMINPLFILRYSATHKRLFNQIYKLDSYDAYQNNLVKKIEVKTVYGAIPKNYPYVRYVEFTKDLYARIEIFIVEEGGVIRTKQVKVRGGDSVYELSGSLDQYKSMIVQEDPHKKRKLKISNRDEIIELGIGESNFNIGKEEVVRIQIRLAIENHLQKQLFVLKKGYKIKVLTLFFIDAVDKYRDHSVADGRGEYLRIFDEEYLKLINDPKWSKVFLEYPELFKQYTEIHRVREGYFAVDKNKNIVEIENWHSMMDEQKLKVKAQEDIDRGIELILEKKDELISFEEPLAFIFSHSALREGWDSPNVFTLCTLKKSSSDIAKKQEIGRGLRLPVDIYGNRCTDSQVNILTVIANDYYDHFAALLQRDFNENTGFKRDEVTFDVLYNTLRKAGISDTKVMEIAEIFREELIRNGIVNKDGILIKDVKRIQNVIFDNGILQEYSVQLKENFIEAMFEKGSKSIYIRNGDEETTENDKGRFISEKCFTKLLKELSNRRAEDSIYPVNIDNAAFIQACIAEVNELLRYKQIRNEYRIERGEANFDDLKKLKMSEASVEKVFESTDEKGGEKSDFEIINYIMYHTMLPRLAIYKIISGLEKKSMLLHQDILSMVTTLAKNKLTECMEKDKVRYDVTGGYVLDESIVFETEQIDRELLDDVSSRVLRDDVGGQLYLQKYPRCERKSEFARKLESEDRVLFYTNFTKGGFVIDTPYGEYSPDWAVIINEREDGKAMLLFIVEIENYKGEERWQNSSMKLKKLLELSPNQQKVGIRNLT